MGQYHYLVNFDRKEIVHPHALGLRLKQFEHTHCIASLSDVLYMLVCTSPNRGGGDLLFDQDLENQFNTFGRWVGDRCLVYGDYTEPEDVPFIKSSEFGKYREYTDITQDVVPAFEKAFGVKTYVDSIGCTHRKLTSDWKWLFPDIETSP